MTRKEAWVRFMAGAMTVGGRPAGLCASIADQALEEFDKRWTDDAEFPPKPRRFVGDDEPRKGP